MPEFEYTKLEAEKHFAIAEALIEAYQHRLNTMGHAGDFGDRSCTTHINTLDADGKYGCNDNDATIEIWFRDLYITVHSILMNNGINWFDPRQGKPNSVPPQKKPLSNMCPVIALRMGNRFFLLERLEGERCSLLSFK